MNNKEEFTLREWAESLPEAFDLSVECKVHIMPLIDEIQAKCQELGMPIFIMAVTAQDEVGAACCESATMPCNRTPSGMLAAKYASKIDHEGYSGVMLAASIRSAAIKKASGAVKH